MKNDKINYPPGTLIYTGDYTDQETKMELYSFDESEYTIRQIRSIDEVPSTPQKKWLNVIGLNNIDIIREIGNRYGISDLVLEDILNPDHRSKLEYIDDKLFAVLKMVYLKKNKIVHEQLSLLVLDKLIITFQEIEGDVFDTLRGRISNGKGYIRTLNIDYLFYSMLDAIVDHYYTALEFVETLIDHVEEIVMNEENDAMDRIYSTKKELIYLRSSILPIKDLVRNLTSEDFGLVNDSTKAFFSDLNDHLVEISDALMLDRELLSSLTETHISNISNNMNKVMTVLTIFSAIFIPLSFLTGFFGMNFSTFPGIHYAYGVHVFIVGCIVLAVSMIAFFKYKGWL
ncbi:MAG: Magnesium and cobalt transport protein CorA [Clostridiales bacterium 38_11]|nr:MAG: Magnesium and cobalt transport protein CorA [Clostridiales bacterium 38_11]HBH13278.1 magnesium and cobalt transport protein CorA [Clostridiales bacterium]